jgi:hypothetical protein
MKKKKKKKKEEKNYSLTTYVLKMEVRKSSVMSIFTHRHGVISQKTYTLFKGKSAGNNNTYATAKRAKIFNVYSAKLGAKYLCIYCKCNTLLLRNR